MPTTIRLDTDTESRIRRLAETTGRSQSFYITEMIEREIDRIEWEYGILADAEAARAGTLETISLEDMKARLGMDD